MEGMKQRCQKEMINTNLFTSKWKVSLARLGNAAVTVRFGISAQMLCVHDKCLDFYGLLGGLPTLGRSGVYS